MGQGCGLGLQPEHAGDVVLVTRQRRALRVRRENFSSMATVCARSKNPLANIAAVRSKYLKADVLWYYGIMIQINPGTCCSINQPTELEQGISAAMSAPHLLGPFPLLVWRQKPGRDTDSKLIGQVVRVREFTHGQSCDGIAENFNVQKDKIGKIGRNPIVIIVITSLER